MTTFSTHIDATGGQDDVFEYLATFSNAREWDPGVSDGEALTPGPASVGSVYRLGVRMAGRDVPFDYRIIEIERPRRVVLEARRGRIVSRDTITVERAGSGSGSLVRYDAVLLGRGLMRLASPVIARVFTSMAKRAAAGLRATLT